MMQQTPRLFPGLSCLPLAMALLLAARACVQAQHAATAYVDQLVLSAGQLHAGDNLKPFRELETMVGRSIADPQAREAVEAGLLKLLAPENTYEARKFACTQLGILGGQQALPEIGRLLRDDQTAGIACLALSTYPPGPADALLRDAVPKVSPAAKLQVINTLGQRRDEGSMKLFKQAAQDPNPALAETGVAALGRLGTSSALSALGSLKPAQPATLKPLIEAALLDCARRITAAEGLSGRVTRVLETLARSGSTSSLRRGAFQTLIDADPKHAEARILASLNESDLVLRPVAIAAVRKLPPGKPSISFAALLPQLSPNDQVLLIDSLGLRDDPDARRAVVDALRSQQPEVRRAAVEAIGRSGDPHAGILLARALARCADAEERKLLENVVIGFPYSSHTDEAVLVELRKATGLTRATLLNVLGVRTGPLANTVALRELSGNDPDVQKAALKILARTGGATELGPLLAALPRLTGVADEAGAALASVLGRIENPAARSGPVVDALQTADAVELRTLLMSALPVCDTDRALDAARRSLSDPDPAVQKAAVRALAEWPTMAAWDSLLAVFQQPGNETQRSLALNGLTRLLADENARPSAALFGRYAQLFSAARGDADIRLVLGALGGAASPDALALAYPLLERSAVHPEASAAIKRIAEAIQKDHPQAAREALDKIKPGS